MKTDANLQPFYIPRQIFEQKFVFFARNLTKFYVSKCIFRNSSA